MWDDGIPLRDNGVHRRTRGHGNESWGNSEMTVTKPYVQKGKQSMYFTCNKLIYLKSSVYIPIGTKIFSFHCLWTACNLSTVSHRHISLPSMSLLSSSYRLTLWSILSCNSLSSIKVNNFTTQSIFPLFLLFDARKPTLQTIPHIT